MKRYLSFGMFVCVLLIVTGAAFASASSVWHGYSQSTRNSKILARAQQDLGKITGVECKQWVQNVVYSASNGVVWLPQTKSNWYQWYSSSDVQAVPYPSPATMAGPGCIIQMKWRNQDGTVYPHTAIVVSSTSSGMTWIDCNWNGDTKVRTHTVSYTAFYNAVNGYNYTLYYVK